MSAGITRVHGYVHAPSQRPSTLSFYTIDFNTTITTTVVGGAFEKAILACQNFATVAMIGTLDGQNVRIAIEDTGADALSPSYLGTGPTNSSPASTAAALQAAIRALGATAGADSVDLTGATVVAFTL